MCVFGESESTLAHVDSEDGGAFGGDESEHLLDFIEVVKFDGENKDARFKLEESVA